MAKKSAVKQMEELFKKVEEVKEKFEVASQKALEEAEVLKQEIQEEEKEVSRCEAWCLVNIEPADSALMGDDRQMGRG